MWTLQILVLSLAAISQAAYPSGYGDEQQLQHQPVRFDPPAPVDSHGNVVDTPEVRAAKAYHFEQFQKAAARASADKQQQQQQPQQYASAEYQNDYPTGFQRAGAYPAQPAVPSYSRNAYQSAPSQQPQYARPSPAPQYYSAPSHQQQYYPSAPQYNAQQSVGPKYPSPIIEEEPQYRRPVSYAQPKHYAPKVPFEPAPLAEDGTVIDTKDVAELKAARLAELEQARARAIENDKAHYANGGYDNGRYDSGEGTFTRWRWTDRIFTFMESRYIQYALSIDQQLHTHTHTKSHVTNVIHRNNVYEW